ncbi:hypothetical protein PR202_ga27559 [Eleusine coracana subsp. coracana]|uniref:NB-ARC domain-containing protein n=1 Tax=Eleusine coracana subsp. coracana TaxID=191504 RepID=A0AAV5DGU1_ELECO|nr:hypothetical protein PR202_ga27559 [Eleusine coracana subsp. coracana]
MTSASEEEIIEHRLKSKRFLLVLDDIWACQEDEWKKLLALLSKGGEKGCVVLVTTRILEVGRMVNTADSLMELGRLEDEEFMKFFEACAFDHPCPWEHYPLLRDVGRKIVNNLKGSPLAAKTVGRLLRNNITVELWTKISESREWEQKTGDNDIMPALKLSYDYLPFHLQQCFSYCALFPEDYEFDGNELIYWWIGQDLLHSLDQNKTVEDVGHKYLNDLVNHAFFRKTENENGHPRYIVHDLLHELALKMVSHECLSICCSNLRSKQISPYVRHLSIIIDEDIQDRETFEYYKKDFSALDKRIKFENLRTLMLFGKYQGCFVNTIGDLFRKATALRTIFCGESYNVEDLVPRFSKLVHLRYLRISRDTFTRLPPRLPITISRLYQLKILDVYAIYNSSLQRDINNLINLQHFVVSNISIESNIYGADKLTHLHSEILEVGKLHNLKELRKFEVKKENCGFELKQLEKLQGLQVLGIYNLEKAKGNDEASEAKLIQKQSLKELTLDWGFSRSEHAMQDENFLEYLKRHSNLQKLSIKRHRGAKCPTWLGKNL